MFRVEDLFREVMRNAALLIGGRATNALLSLAALAVAARGLGLAQFGVLVLIQSFAESVSDVVKFQSWQTVLHFGAKPLNDGRVLDLQRVLRFTVVLDLLGSVVGVIVGIAGAAVVGPWLNWPPGLAPAAMMYATSIAFMASATPLGVLRLYSRFDLLAGQATVASLVSLVGGLVALGLHLGLRGYLVVWWCGGLAAFLFLCGGAWRELHRRGALVGLHWRRGHLTRGFPGIWRFALTTNANATLALTTTHVSTLIVGALLSPSQAALWRVAKLVGDTVAAPADMVVNALYPELAKLFAAGDNRALGRLALRIGAVVGAVATVTLVVAAFGGGPLLGLALGKGFSAAGPVLTWQVASAALSIWALPLEPLLISTGRAGAAFRARLTVAICYLLCLAPLIHRFGVIGAGVASVGGSVLMVAGMMLGVLGWYRDPNTGLARRAQPPKTLT